MTTLEGPRPAAEERPPGKRLAGRRVLVTGSSTGIGLATAMRLVEEGASVVVNSRDASRAQEAATAVAAGADGSVRVVPRHADVSVPDEATALVDWAADSLGGLDGLVNNVGVTMTGPSESLPIENWERALATILTAPFVCAQAAARHMLAAGTGVIVNVSSIFGHVGMPQRAAYGTAKHGLGGLTRVLATEWADRGVRVLNVDPGFVSTELVERAQETGTAAYTYDDLNRRTPLGRVARPDEVAAVVAFALSADASYMTGSSLIVDGGWLAYGGW